MAMAKLSGKLWHLHKIKNKRQYNNQPVVNDVAKNIKTIKVDKNALLCCPRCNIQELFSVHHWKFCGGSNAIMCVAATAIKNI